jgi:uncharacterized heparinase superfamily protein
MNLLRLFHTVRWLKSGQLAAQIRHRLGPPIRQPKTRPQERDEVEDLHTVVANRPIPEVAGRGARRWPASELREGRFDFLNKEVSLGFPPDWAPESTSKLWQYNLHYFEYLWSLPPSLSAPLVLDWMDQHPVGARAVGWEPYPLSLRVQNWLLYFLGRHYEFTASEPEFARRLLGSLDLQRAMLEQNLEYHLLGNHLFENAATLALLGACLGEHADSSLHENGFQLLESEVGEQILSDGSHFERTPMYQSRLTYLMSQLGAVDHPRLSSIVDEPLERMRTALALMTHPDGDIALFNDAAFGIAPRPADMGLGPASPGRFALRAGGYFGARTSSGHYVICDAGPIGPDYIPGHAHGDMFSFELSLKGSRVVVDSGVFGYEPDEMRAYCRSTAAHNTVEIGGQDQCEFWGSFRVARRGRPSGVQYHETDDGFTLEGQHDGYARLSGKPMHHRRMRWRDRGILLVTDHVSTARPIETASRLHLHPGCEIVSTENGLVEVNFAGGSFVVGWKGPGHLQVEPSWYCPEFGVRIENQALVYRATAPCETAFCIAPSEEEVSFEG